MPQTKAGSKVQRALEQEYGKKGKDIYFALQVEGKGGKGKHRWEGAKPGGTLAKARHTFMSKKRLTTKDRNAIPSRDFAGPKRSYPIEDKAHARNALARVSQHGSSSEKAKVRAAVHRKFPDIGKKKISKDKAYEKMRRKVFGLK